MAFNPTKFQAFQFCATAISTESTDQYQGMVTDEGPVHSEGLIDLESDCLRVYGYCSVPASSDGNCF